MRLGRYTLLQRIGFGGMAEVFLARQDGVAGFQKTVVIKRILPQFAANPRFIEMFQREANLAARLSHTNIVQILELGEEQGTTFIAMEHVDGLTLHRLAVRAWKLGRSLSIEVVCAAMADVALGLQHAHGQRGAGAVGGLVHRDLTPDNLMINREGVTKILDFGIAKPISDEGRRPLTETGEMKGKIPFMPPEQIVGGAIDARADIYTLGVGFYWLLTGRRPVTGNSELELMTAVLERVPELPSKLNPAIPPQLDELILGMLEKNPLLRPQTADEVHDELAFTTAYRRRMTVPFVQQMMDATVDNDQQQPPTLVHPAALANTNLENTWGVADASGSFAVPPRRRSELDVAVAEEPEEPEDTAVGRDLPIDNSLDSIDQSEEDDPIGPPVTLEESEQSALRPLATQGPHPALASQSETQTPTPQAEPPSFAYAADGEEAATVVAFQADLVRATRDAGDQTAPQDPRRDLAATTRLPVSLVDQAARGVDRAERTALQGHPAVRSEAEQSAELTDQSLSPLPAGEPTMIGPPPDHADASDADHPRVSSAESAFERTVVIPSGGAPPLPPVRSDQTPYDFLLRAARAVPTLSPAKLAAAAALLVVVMGIVVVAIASLAGDSEAAVVAAPAVAVPVVDPATAPDAAPETDPVDDAALLVDEPAPVDPRGRDRPRAEPTRKLTVKAPPTVRWFDQGRALGKGSAVLDVPERRKSIVAFDMQRGARTVVPVGAGDIDYARLPRGKLLVRASPYADVTLGREALGPTPFQPLDVVAGTYTVRLVYDKREIKKVVEVRAGETAKVTVDFLN